MVTTSLSEKDSDVYVLRRWHDESLTNANTRKLSSSKAMIGASYFLPIIIFGQPSQVSTQSTHQPALYDGLEMTKR